MNGPNRAQQMNGPNRAQQMNGPNRAQMNPLLDTLGFCLAPGMVLGCILNVC